MLYPAQWLAKRGRQTYNKPLINSCCFARPYQETEGAIFGVRPSRLVKKLHVQSDFSDRIICLHLKIYNGSQHLIQLGRSQAKSDFTLIVFIIIKLLYVIQKNFSLKRLMFVVLFPGHLRRSGAGFPWVSVCRASVEWLGRGGCCLY